MERYALEGGICSWDTCMEKGRQEMFLMKRVSCTQGTLGVLIKMVREKEKREERAKYCSIKWCTVQLIFYSLPMLDYITGCSKEMIITKGGENVAPVPIEKVIA